jgi:hypothetical protein
VGPRGRLFKAMPVKALLVELRLVLTESCYKQSKLGLSPCSGSLPGDVMSSSQKCSHHCDAIYSMVHQSSAKATILPGPVI